MQRNKQKIEDLEKAIEERERRLKRVGQSVAQVQPDAIESHALSLMEQVWGV